MSQETHVFISDHESCVQESSSLNLFETFDILHVQYIIDVPFLLSLSTSSPAETLEIHYD